MPYMIGPSPIRRTVKYLEAGRLFLNDRIRIMNVHYNYKGDHHSGIRDFVFWFVPQIQYQNKNVQVLPIKDMTPSPFIRCFYDNGYEMIIDCDSRTKEEILDHCIQVIGKSKEQLAKEASVREEKENPSQFGVGCKRSCICEVFGQVPCPAVCPLPKHMRGKYMSGNLD